MKDKPPGCAHQQPLLEYISLFPVVCLAAKLWPISLTGQVITEAWPSMLGPGQRAQPTVPPPAPHPSNRPVQASIGKCFGLIKVGNTLTCWLPDKYTNSTCVRDTYAQNHTRNNSAYIHVSENIYCSHPCVWEYILLTSMCLRIYSAHIHVSENI